PKLAMLWAIVSHRPIFTNFNFKQTVLTQPTDHSASDKSYQ
ncbi:19745_t:CDS:1, partial [Gigaspora margarita]